MMINAFRLALILLIFYGLCGCLDFDSALEQRQRFRIDTRVSRSPDLPKYELKNTIWNKKFRKNPKKFYQVVDKTYDDKYGFNTKKNFTTFLLETFQSASVKDVVKNKDVRVKYRELLENVRTNCGLRGLFTMLKCLRADAEDCKLECEPKLEKRDYDPEFEEFYRTVYGNGNRRGQKRSKSAENVEENVDENASPSKKPRVEDQSNDVESDTYSDDEIEADDEFSEDSEEDESDDYDSEQMLSYFSSRGNNTESQKGSKESEKPRKSREEGDDEDENYSYDDNSDIDEEEEEQQDERKTRSKEQQKEPEEETDRKRRRKDFEKEEEDFEEESEDDRFMDNRNRNREDERRRRDSDEEEDFSDDESEDDAFTDNRNRDRDRDREDDRGDQRKSEDSYLRRKEEDDGNELREVGSHNQNQPRNSFWGGILSFIGKLTMGIIIGLCIIIVMVGLGILFTLGAMLIVTIALIIHAAVRGRNNNQESVNAALTPNNVPKSANGPSLPNNAAPAPNTDLVEQKEEAPRRPW